MSDTNKIFVILDPTTMNQPSLVMAETIAQDILSSGAAAVALHLYCCIAESTVRRPTGMDEETALAEEHARIQNWVERMAIHSRSLGLEVDTEVEIQPDWREAIVAAAARNPSMIAVKNMTEQTRLTRFMRDTSDWKLLRDVSCPLFMVKSYARRHIRKVLVAIKHRPEKKIYTQANDRILDTGRMIAKNLGADLHVVTAYKDVDDYPDRQKFADRCGLPRNQVTAAMGKPEEAIAEAANDLQADLLVIARVGRPEDSDKVGRTAERLIDNLESNILVLPMT
ncbi:MAG: universal stress protein [Gammaproteobacteria bacterium]|nr:universal stress protein [Gammaproteobacteria bacterium]